MKQVVIMPGGFHPFHAGHYALYQSAVKEFPEADVYVAATADTSTRPFPFPVKEKLAQLAGVPADRFVQVKSPFRSNEITSAYDPKSTQLIFVRSEKDRGSQPQPGGVKKDGNPSYLQPWDGKGGPMSQHAYMEYLPTVEFGPGIKSATEIRTAWPTLDERRKTALVMSLYPKTQTNPKLAATVVKLLDAAIGTQAVAEGWIKNDHYNDDRTIDPKTGKPYILMGPAGQGEWDPLRSGIGGKMPVHVYPGYKAARAAADKLGKKVVRAGVSKWKVVPKNDPAEEIFSEEDVEENQGWAATLEASPAAVGANTAGAGAGMSASYQRRENQPIGERNQREIERDPEFKQTWLYARQHYPEFAGDEEMAFDKWVQRALKHSLENDDKHSRILHGLVQKIRSLEQQIAQIKSQSTQSDYINENQSENP